MPSVPLPGPVLLVHATLHTILHCTASTTLHRHCTPFCTAQYQLHCTPFYTVQHPLHCTLHTLLHCCTTSTTLHTAHPSILHNIHYTAQCTPLCTAAQHPLHCTPGLQKIFFVWIPNKMCAKMRGFSPRPTMCHLYVYVPSNLLIIG